MFLYETLIMVFLSSFNTNESMAFTLILGLEQLATSSNSRVV